MVDITITIPTAQAGRLQAAFEEALGLDRPATVSDARDYIINDLKQFVRTSEKRVAANVAQASVTDLDIT